MSFDHPAAGDLTGGAALRHAGDTGKGANQADADTDDNDEALDN